MLGAAGRGDETAVQRWLDEGGSPDARGGAAGHTMLMRASAAGRLRVVQLLAAAGADMNAVDSEGSSALHAAAYKGHLACVRALVRAGVATEIADRDGETALQWAASQGHQTIVELLRGQIFRPRVLPSMLDASQIERLLALREQDGVGPVHDDGAGHEVIFLHACRHAKKLSQACEGLLDGLAEAMRAHDPRASLQAEQAAEKGDAAVDGIIAEKGGEAAAAAPIAAASGISAGGLSTSGGSCAEGQGNDDDDGGGGRGRAARG